MIKRFTSLVIVSMLLLSCGTVISTMLDVKRSEAKRLANDLLTENVDELDLESFNISDDFRKYLLSSEGQEYYKNIRLNNGNLHKLKFQAFIGSSADTMNYRYLANFKNQRIEQEVRVQTYDDKEIIDVLITPWKSEMLPIAKSQQ